MDNLTNEEILYNCYLKLGSEREAKASYVERALDKAAISGIMSKTSYVLMQLDESVLLMTDVRKALISAKGLFAHYSLIKGRNPDCVYSSLIQNMDKLIRAMAKREAEMIDALNLQSPGEVAIDIQWFFDHKKKRNALGTRPAREIIDEAMKKKEDVIRFSNPFYVTETGKKYHRNDCPYCSGRILKPTNKAYIDHMNLKPCRCLSAEEKGNVDKSCITAYVDESIRRGGFDGINKKKKVGNYSYIIAWGKLRKESKITENRLITKGVGYIEESKNTSAVTESAIGKVLTYLAFELGYCGTVFIYTDNQSVVSTWNENIKNQRLSKLFYSVKVQYIPREKNKRADSLLRSRILLDLPMSSYDDVIKRLHTVEELEKKIEKLERQFDAKVEIPKVIVAKQVECPQNDEVVDIKKASKTIEGLVEK